MSVEMIRGLYDYHRWANRRLFEVATALGEELTSREVGKQFSYSTIRRMFGHLYGADRIWLSRWTGVSLTTIPGAEFATLASIRAPWDDLEREQRAVIDGLSAADLDRVIEYRNAEGKQFKFPLGPLLQHVANHATHHRSEIATMLTMVSDSPPDTGLATYLVTTSQQR
ncbi:MAG TPA: DinB family protein [Candidatus Binatia bacterium]|nr:DinB family protein [Candidatus Binatia bacterium]